MNNIICKITFDGIYSGNIAKIELYANNPFCVNILDENIIVSGIDMGEEFNNFILPKQNKEKYIICFDVVGIIKEAPISVSEGNSGVETYGMQYFPFVSSFIDFKFKVLFGRIKSISIDVPKSCRMIWFSDKVILNSKYKLEKVHSYGEKTSSYIYDNKQINLINTSKFIKKEDIIGIEDTKSIEHIKSIIVKDNMIFHNNNIDIYAKFRLSGEKLGGLTIYSSLYFMTSMAGIWFVSWNYRLVGAGIIAYYVIMVKFFQNSNPPQARTIFMDIILTGVVLITVFGILLVYFNSKINNYIILILSLSLIYVFLNIYANVKFSRNGTLPTFLENFFYWRRRCSELKNKSKFE